MEGRRKDILMISVKAQRSQDCDPILSKFGCLFFHQINYQNFTTDQEQGKRQRRDKAVTKIKKSIKDGFRSKEFLHKGPFVIAKNLKENRPYIFKALLKILEA